MWTKFFKWQKNLNKKFTHIHVNNVIKQQMNSLTKRVASCLWKIVYIKLLRFLNV